MVTGKNLLLGDMYMLLYGQTWYQKYLNAIPVQISNQVIHLSRTLSKKPKMDWHKLWSDVCNVPKKNIRFQVQTYDDKIIKMKADDV